MADQMAELMILVEAVGVDKAIASLEKAQKKMGDTAKKAKNDTKALEQFAQKFGGAMAIISASITGAVGALLVQMPIMGELFDALAYFVETLAYALDNVLRPVLSVLVNAVYWLSDAFEDLSPGMQKVILIGGLIVVAIIAIVIAFASLVIGILTGSTATLVFLGVIGLLLQGIIFVVVNLALLALALISLIGIVPLLIIVFILFHDEIIAVLKVVGSALITFFAFIGEAIVSGVKKVIGFFEPLTTFLGDMWDGLKDGVTEKWDEITLLIGTKILAVKTKIESKLSVIKTYWDTFWGSLITGFADVWDAIYANIVVVLADIVDIAKSQIQLIIDVIQLLLAILTGDWKTAWAEAKSIVSDYIDIIKGVGTLVEDAFNGIGNVIIASLNNVISSLNELKIEIPDWVPGFGGKKWSPNIPKIPSLRSEGIINKSGVAEVHSGEGVFAMKTLQDAMYNAIVMAGMNGGQAVQVYLDGRLVSEILGNSDNVSLGSQGGGY